MSRYLRTYADCDRAFPRDESVQHDEYDAVRQRCYDCVGTGKVMAITPSGDTMQLSCQPVAAPERAEKRGGLWAAAIIGIGTAAVIYWSQR